MAPKKQKTSSREVWTLVHRQHGRIARWQLVDLGFTADAIRHRIESGRLRKVRRGVYAVGRMDDTPEGRWMEVVLACGPAAVLSHESAAALWGLRPSRILEVTVPTYRREPGVKVHRRPLAERDVTHRTGIPVTSPIRTIVDLATRLPDGPLERCINEADQRYLATPVQIRAALDRYGKQRGVARLRKLLDIRTFRFTRSDLERVFIPLATRAGLPIPLTRVWLDGFEVDFYWPDLDLVVETDGLTYHRTPQQQAEDLLRDQAHKAAGRECLRFSHGQIRFTPRHVEAVLACVGARLVSGASS